VRRVWISLSILAVVAAVVVPNALSTRRSTPNLPALKLKGNVARGKRVFISAGCAGCDVLRAAHHPPAYALGPNLDTLKPSFSLVVRTVSLGKSPPGDPGAGMPAFSRVKGASRTVQTVLTSQQIADVAKYVSTVAGH
jgi:mono/diheme cytochrome c family protein